jgi:nitrogen fixation-related uncharacterized protein
VAINCLRSSTQSLPCRAGCILFATAAVAADEAGPFESPIPKETSTPKDRRVVYIVITVALVLLLIICFVFYRSAQSSQQAQDKANQLIAALQKAGDRGQPLNTERRKPTISHVDSSLSNPASDSVRRSTTPSI